MKGPANNFIALAAQQGSRPFQHLFRRTAREGQEKDRGRIDTFLNHTCNTEYKRARLAASGSGKDQQRSCTGNHGFILSRVQLFLILNKKMARLTDFRLAS